MKSCWSFLSIFRFMILESNSLRQVSSSHFQFIINFMAHLKVIIIEKLKPQLFLTCHKFKWSAYTRKLRGEATSTFFLKKNFFNEIFTESFSFHPPVIIKAKQKTSHTHIFGSSFFFCFQTRRRKRQIYEQMNDLFSLK